MIIDVQIVPSLDTGNLFKLIPASF
jgi:hypothetical protein